MTENVANKTEKFRLILLFGVLGSVILAVLGLYAWFYPNETFTIVHQIEREQYDYAATNLFRGGLMLLALISFLRHRKTMQKGFLGGYICICAIDDFTNVMIALILKDLSLVWYIIYILYFISLMGMLVCYFVISANKDGSIAAGNAMNVFLIILVILTLVFAVFSLSNGQTLCFVEKLGDMFGYLFLGAVSNVILLKKQERKNKRTGGTPV